MDQGIVTSTGSELTKEDFDAIVEVFYLLKIFRDKNAREDTLELNRTNSLMEDNS